jgi:hypothetical protein
VVCQCWRRERSLSQTGLKPQFLCCPIHTPVTVPTALSLNNYCITESNLVIRNFLHCWVQKRTLIDVNCHAIGCDREADRRHAAMNSRTHPLSWRSYYQERCLSLSVI